MKEAVLKILNDILPKILKRVNALPEGENFEVMSINSDIEILRQKLSALPEQGYTREQVEAAIIEGKRIYATCQATYSSPYKDEIDIKMTNDYLDSLTPVAVEAERTERECNNCKAAVKMVSLGEICPQCFEEQ